MLHRQLCTLLEQIKFICRSLILETVRKTSLWRAVHSCFEASKNKLYTYISCNCVILSTIKGGQINFSVIRSWNKVFLVPDSCRATERNGNSISPDIIDDTNEND